MAGPKRTASASPPIAPSIPPVAASRHGSKQLAKLPAETLTGVQIGRERAVLWTIGVEILLLIPYAGVSIWSGSLTLLADSLRSVQSIVQDCFMLSTLRQIQRNRMYAYEFGAGKIEQYQNLSLAVGLLIGAGWIAWHCFKSLTAPDAPDATQGLSVAFFMAVLNVLVSVVTLNVIWRAGRDGTSILLSGQIHTRVAKVGASLVVALATGLTALFPDSSVGWYADLAGSGFVAAVMIVIAVKLWRQALPHLLDQTLDEARQTAINQVLVRHFMDYEDLLRVRSRQSGNTMFVEITLGFDAQRTIGEIDGVIRTISAEIQDLIPGASVTIAAHAVAADGGLGTVGAPVEASS